MYHHCLFCQADLGANESVEHFPVGRRLAFDGAKGRLWVVCPKCGRWNLTPLEERWEAIEECERQYRATRLRASTENVGLARLRSGLELVRIGAPLRPEFSAWRYGAKLGLRRRRAQLAVGAGSAVTVVAGVAAGHVVLPTIAMATLPIVAFPMLAMGFVAVPIAGALALRDYLHHERVVGRVMGKRGRPLTVRAKHLDWADLSVGRDGGDASLDLPHDGGSVHLQGSEALRVLGQLMAGANRLGASESQVREAILDVEEAGDAAAYLARTSAKRGWRGTRLTSLVNEMRGLGALHLAASERLALEMALNEESEYRALEGELAALEQAWRDAEQIAQIADDLLLPESVSEWLGRSPRGAVEQ